MTARESRAMAVGAALLCTALLLACGASGRPFPPGFNLPASSALTDCTDAGLLPGVDVSEYDATVNWPEARDAGIVFAIARVSDGLDFPDPYFDSNWADIKSVGMIRGVYQFFEPDQDPHLQAQLLLSHIPDFGPGDLAPVIDVETLDSLDAGDAAGAVQTWVADIEGALGRRPIIYTSARVWTEFDNPPLSADLWVANWDVPCPAIPTTWSGPGWLFWQYSSTGTVPGLTAEPADLDRFNGSLAELETYANGPVSLDGGSDAGADGGLEDAGPVDAGASDGGAGSGAGDGGEDAGIDDAGIEDAGAGDAGIDGGARDGGSAGCPIDTVDAGGRCVSICGEGTVLDGGICTVVPSSGGCASGNSGWLACAGALFAMCLRRKRPLRAPRKPC